MIAGLAAQQLPHRHAQGLALEIPQRQVQRAQGVLLLAPGGIEIATIHLLPQLLGAERIGADQHAGALLHRVGRAAFADADQPARGLHDHDIGGLVEGRLLAGAGGHAPPRRVIGGDIIADTLDAILGQAQCLGGRRRPQRRRGGARGHAGHHRAAIEFHAGPLTCFCLSPD